MVAELIGRPGEYFTGFRYDIVDLIPPGTQRLLSVGCGAGTTELYLKHRRGIPEVVGIEREPDIAAHLEGQLDRVLVGDIEQLTLPYPQEYFDCILYLDVLEHLVNPWALLKRHAEMLARGGTVIISVPNVRYYYSLLHLLFGEWRYSNRGLMDWSHLRYFTLGTAKQMLSQAGLVPQYVRRRYRLMDTPGRDPFTRGLKRVLDKINRPLSCWHIYDCFPYLREFITFQYIIVARKLGRG